MTTPSTHPGQIRRVCMVCQHVYGTIPCETEGVWDSHGYCDECGEQALAEVASWKQSILPGSRSEPNSQSSHDAHHPSAVGAPAPSLSAGVNGSPHASCAASSATARPQASTLTQGGGVEGHASPNTTPAGCDRGVANVCDSRESTQASPYKPEPVSSPARPESPSGSAFFATSSRSDGGGIPRDAEPLIYPRLGGTVDAAESEAVACSWVLAGFGAVVLLAALLA